MKNLMNKLQAASVTQVGGLAAIVAGVWTLTGVGWALLALGAACIVTGVALERGDE